MRQLTDFFLRTIAVFFISVLFYSCDSTTEKQEENDALQDADKTEMMEEEHQMDPAEGELLKEDTLQE